MMANRRIIKVYSTINWLRNSNNGIKIREPKHLLNLNRYLRGMPNVKTQLIPPTDLVPTNLNASDLSRGEEIPSHSEGDGIFEVPDGEYLDTIAPPIPKSFNLAAYANKSATLRKLIEMGVDLNRVERLGYGQYYAQLDFDKDVKNTIVFLNSIGVDPKDLRHCVTRNPAIFQESIENLQTRITYFKRKAFTNQDVARIITIVPLILSFSVKGIDASLGFLQREFKLSGDQVRLLIATQPKLLLNKFLHTKEISFVVKEEFGFSEDETRELLLKCPKFWLISRKKASERLDYIHNEIGISHEEILKFPRSLLWRKFLLDQRHRYLQTLGRAQYDKTKPNYISLMDITAGDDVHFCQNIAKSSVQDFNEFLKTL